MIVVPAVVDVVEGVMLNDCNVPPLTFSVLDGVATKPTAVAVKITDSTEGYALVAKVAIPFTAVAVALVNADDPELTVRLINVLLSLFSKLPN